MVWWFDDLHWADDDDLNLIRCGTKRIYIILLLSSVFWLLENSNSLGFCTQWKQLLKTSVQVSHSVMSDSATPWTTACQPSLSITNSYSLLKLMYIESVMPSNHLILCCPLLILPSIFPSIRGFSNESFLCIRWSKYWRFSFSQHQSFQWLFRADFL